MNEARKQFGQTMIEPRDLEAVGQDVKRLLMAWVHSPEFTAQRLEAAKALRAYLKTVPEVDKALGDGIVTDEIMALVGVRMMPPAMDAKQAPDALTVEGTKFDRLFNDLARSLAEFHDAPDLSPYFRYSPRSAQRFERLQERKQAALASLIGKEQVAATA
jgi:hypothetical protein